MLYVMIKLNISFLVILSMLWHLQIWYAFPPSMPLMKILKSSGLQYKPRSILLILQFDEEMLLSIFKYDFESDNKHATLPSFN